MGDMMGLSLGWCCRLPSCASKGSARAFSTAFLLASTLETARRLTYFWDSEKQESPAFSRACRVPRGGEVGLAGGVGRRPKGALADVDLAAQYCTRWFGIVQCSIAICAVQLGVFRTVEGGDLQLCFGPLAQMGGCCCPCCVVCWPQPAAWWEGWRSS